jgi:hypothetical protein
MRRLQKNPARKFSADSQRLATLAHSIARAYSRLEGRSWGDRLDQVLKKLLASNQQQAIDSALDHLFHTDLDAYDTLLDAIEAVSSSCRLTHDNKSYDALLIAVPVLAWTRFSIAAGPIPAGPLQTITAHLHGHILAADTHAAIAPALYSIDQLPRTYCETYQLTQRMAEAALAGKAISTPQAFPETVAFLADTRYLLLVVAAEAGRALLRWQEEEAGPSFQASSSMALTQWQTQAGPNLQNLLPGCGIELLLPGAYYVACREADKAIRPISLRAAVNYLTTALSTEPGQLAVVIAGFGDEANGMRVDEFRISFSVSGNSDVYYGVVWPLYDEESAEDYLSVVSNRRMSPGAVLSPVQQIIAVLRDAGVTRLQQVDTVFPPEFCDDCGSPLFCDSVEEIVHAEMPEESAQSHGHLH